MRHVEFKNDGPGFKKVTIDDNYIGYLAYNEHSDVWCVDLHGLVFSDLNWMYSRYLSDLKEKVVEEISKISDRNIVDGIDAIHNPDPLRNYPTLYGGN